MKEFCSSDRILQRSCAGLLGFFGGGGAHLVGWEILWLVQDLLELVQNTMMIGGIPEPQCYQEAHPRPNLG